MKTKRNNCYHGKTHRQLYMVHAFGLVLSLQDGRLSASNISRAMTIDDLRFLVEQDLKEIKSKQSETSQTFPLSPLHHPDMESLRAFFDDDGEADVVFGGLATSLIYHHIALQRVSLAPQ